MELYKDAARNAGERAKDLLGRMTLEEKIGQLQCALVMDTEHMSELEGRTCGIGEMMVQSAQETPARTAEVNRRVIDYVIQNNRLGIPPILHAEALTGAVLPGATIFPSAIGLGATFDVRVVEDMTDTISQQMRSTGYRQALSPVMDLGRDPRWGRVGETYGEDPTLCAMMSVAFTKGLQGEEQKKGVAATGKHFLGYSFGDGGLNMSSNPIPEREIREDYAKPFQAAMTEGGLLSIMNSYGSLDNELVIGSEKVLTDLLRGEMKFDGAVVSDYQSIDKLVSHRIKGSMEEAGVQALKAGLDVECPMPVGYTDELARKVRDGELEEAYIDRAALRVLEMKFRLGLFENPYPVEENVEAAFSSPENVERSLRAARESIVLLKNDGVLPLTKKEQKIAVIGPHADSIRLLFGCYTFPAAIDMGLSGALSEMGGMEAAAEKLDAMERTETAQQERSAQEQDETEATQGRSAAKPDGAEAVRGQSAQKPDETETVQGRSAAKPTYEGSNVLKEPEAVGQALGAIFGQTTPTVLKAIRDKAADAEIIYEKGCEYAGFDRSGFAAAKKAAREADVVIVAVGGKYGWGSSCTVGEGIDSCDIGLTGVQEEMVSELCGLGKPVILLHMDARPLSSVTLKEKCAAILECWYPGSTGGTAIADVLFGDYNPAGRLPATAARNAGQIPIYAGQKTGNAYQAVREKMSLCKYVENSVEPLFPFGHGLSYSKFEYSDLAVAPDVAADGQVEVSFSVKNTSGTDGEEVAQIYVEDVLAGMLRPNREFAGCARIFLKAGEERRLTCRMKASQFAYLDGKMRWLVEAGEMKVYVGASSDDIRLEGAFTICDTKEIEGHRRGFYAVVA